MKQVSQRWLVDKLWNWLKQLPYLPQAVALVWAAARFWMVAWGGLLLLQGLLPISLAYLSRELVNGLIADRGHAMTWAQLQPTIGRIGLIVGLTLFLEALQSLSTWIRTVQAELVRDYISTLIHQQAARIDFAFYDSSDYYDRLYRAQTEAQYRPLILLENSGGFLQNSMTLLGLLLLLLPFGPGLVIALLSGALPTLLVALYYSRRQHQYWLRTTEQERRAWYYDWLLTTRENAAEVRIFNLLPWLRQRYQQVRQTLRQERLQLVKAQGLAELGASSVAFGILGVALVWMIRQALTGQITLGDLALFYQAFTQGQKSLRSLLQNLNQIYGNSLFLSSLFEFLALRPQILDPVHPVPLSLQQGIQFEHVTFAYPESNRTALQDFCLQIPAGQLVAIVGNNGAGKSTLIKLLCRFYDPQQGRILLDGVDLRDLSIAELRRHITVLFQQPVAYNDTVAANIAMGSLAQDPDRHQIITMATAAGADQPIARLPHGYDTLLGRWFAGSTDLSTGEWQRLALARSFLRQSQIMILDEPTSAMDSWAEADWLQRLRSVMRDQTVIMITHRFTTAMQADMIHVMVDGQVIESGGHAQLLAQNGYYAQSWKTQVRELKS